MLIVWTPLAQVLRPQICSTPDLELLPFPTRASRPSLLHGVDPFETLGALSDPCQPLAH